eukprot:TRINITY_DN42627_c0_g1_i1.p1 TRINITY_DN42627_c0_g1~~TRINITY_DN42627_c0_g1_i1.p1  ORF type:complete len:228 (-),score=12.83 TRINITY_DN42627_c0_g1_i1:191-808(-)
MELLHKEPQTTWVDSDCDDDMCFGPGVLGGTTVFSLEADYFFSKCEESDRLESSCSDADANSHPGSNPTVNDSMLSMNLFDLSSGCWKHWEKYAPKGYDRAVGPNEKVLDNKGLDHRVSGCEESNGSSRCSTKRNSDGVCRNADSCSSRCMADWHDSQQVRSKQVQRPKYRKDAKQSATTSPPSSSASTGPPCRTARACEQGLGN